MPAGIRRCLCAALLLIGSAASAQPQQSTVVRRSPFIPDCAADGNGDLCRAPLAFRYEEADQRLGADNLVIWTDGQTLNVAARSATATAELTGSIQEGLAPMSTSGSLWGASYRAPQIGKALVELRSGGSSAVWRGPEAPAAPPSSAVLNGRLEVLDIKSVALGNTRKVAVYVPPGTAPKGGWPTLIAANGEAIAPYVAMIDALIERKQIRPLAVVAIWTGGSPGEYLRGKDPDAYQRHAMFVQREVLPLVEKRFAVTHDAGRRMLFGVDNGGDWAVQTALRETDVARTVAAFSVTGGSEPPFRSGKKLRLLMAAGAFEGPYLKGSRQICSLASASGTPCALDVAQAGHAPLIWQSELAKALTTVFPAGR